MEISNLDKLIIKKKENTYKLLSKALEQIWIPAINQRQDYFKLKEAHYQWCEKESRELYRNNNITISNLCTCYWKDNHRLKTCKYAHFYKSNLSISKEREKQSPHYKELIRFKWMNKENEYWDLITFIRNLWSHRSKIPFEQDKIYEKIYYEAFFILVLITAQCCASEDQWKYFTRMEKIFGKVPLKHLKIGPFRYIYKSQMTNQEEIENYLKKHPIKFHEISYSVPSIFFKRKVRFPSLSTESLKERELISFEGIRKNGMKRNLRTYYFYYQMKQATKLYL